MWQTEYNNSVGQNTYVPPQVPTEGTQGTQGTQEPVKVDPVPPPVEIPLTTKDGKAEKAPQQFIDDVNKKGQHLQEVTTGGKPDEISKARKEYDDALMTEVVNSYKKNDGALPSYFALLHDEAALQVATRQVMKTHADQKFDPNLGASINATVIVKQVEYDPGGPVAVNGDKESLSALQRIGNGLAAAPDPDGSIKKLVLSDPNVQKYVQTVTDQAMKGDFDYAAESISTLGRSSPDLALMLTDKVLGDPANPAKNTILYNIKNAQMGTAVSSVYYSRIAKIVSALEKNPGAKDTIDKIENGLADRMRNNPPISHKTYGTDKAGYGIAELNLKDAPLTPKVFYDLVDKLSTGPNAKPDVVKQIKAELGKAGVPADRPAAIPSRPISR